MVRVADVAITGVSVRRLRRKTSETSSGAKCSAENVGSNQRTCFALGRSILDAIVCTSFVAPFTRARCAIESGSIMSESALMSATTAADASFTLRIGASN